MSSAPSFSKEDVDFKAANLLRKGQFVVLHKTQVCRVNKFSTAKTGKHGGAKIHFHCYNVFTGKKVRFVV
jgi:translation elongation factor P/translation initiation factor 5A